MKILLPIVLSLFVTPNAFAALAAGTYWEVRTTGNNANGGCYDAVTDGGTDYSQQDAAQLTLNDLATAGAGSTTLTSATGGFTAAMVSNCIDIASGTNFTAKVYQITGYTDTNTVTLDSSPTPGGAGSSGVGSVGGGDADFDDSNAYVLASNRVYVKKGTYADTIDPAPSPAYNTVISYVGYNATRDDNPTDPANMPVLDGGSVRNYGIDLNNTQNFYDFNHFHIKDTVSHCYYGDYNNSGAFMFLENCGQAGFWRSSAGVYIEFDSPGTDCAFNSTNGRFVGTYCHDSTDSGFDDMNTNMVLLFNIVDSVGARGIKSDTQQNQIIMNNTIYNSGQVGLNLDGLAQGAGYPLASNNIVTDSGSQGILFANDGDGITTRYSIHNNISYNNTGTDVDITSSIIYDYENDTTTNPEFTDAPNGDFSIGTGPKAGGLPGLFPGELSTSYLDLGAVQREEPAASGGESSHPFVGN